MIIPRNRSKRTRNIAGYQIGQVLGTRPWAGPELDDLENARRHRELQRSRADQKEANDEDESGRPSRARTRRKIYPEK